MKMIKNGLKIDLKKSQNLAKNREKAWAIAHMVKNCLKIDFKKSQN